MSDLKSGAARAVAHVVEGELLGSVEVPATTRARIPGAGFQRDHPMGGQAGGI
jgi:hypothetical protein